MPIRMVQDDDQQQQEPEERGGRRTIADIGGGGRGGGGGIIGMLLPILFRNPKLLLLLLVIVGAVYFFGGKNFLSNVASGAFSSGCGLDPKIYDKAQVFEPLANNAKNPLPEQVSLEKYAPRRMNQGKQGSCVAWSSAYAARTIMRARETGEDPNSIAFSPAYLYNQIALEGCQGSYVQWATQTMEQKGALPLRKFPYDENDCSSKPNSTETQEGSQYAILGANRLTVGGDDQTIDLLAIKQNLAQGAPVIIGMMVGGTFMQEMMGKKVWHPTGDDYYMQGFGGHAMCVIGYDDNLEGGALQIMNSWGPEWGENGIAYVRYKDFMKFAKEAHGLYPMGSAEKPTSKNFSVKFGLVKNDDNSHIQLVNKGGNLFATKTPIKKGDKFKIEVTNSIECYTYIFGQETDGVTYTLFPYTQKHSPYCGITGTRLFPKDHSLQADNVGNKDFMAVVVTKKPLDFNDINNKLNLAGGTNLQQKISKVLNDQLATKVSFNASDVISFDTDPMEKNAVAMILEIDKK